MATPRLSDRIRTAIANAAENLARPNVRASDLDRPAPGDLYVFDAGKETYLEWLVVRAHPDDSELLLLAPIDDFPLAGTPDLVLPSETVGRPMTVRCGETDWFPTKLCTARLRVGVLPEDALTLVRQRLADLARGRPLKTEGPCSDFDPDYEEWSAEIARARVALLARAEAAPPESDVIRLGALSPTQPKQFTSLPRLSLAAETGSALFTDLGQALASTDVKYHEVPDVPGGRLFLVIDSTGVRGVWEGSLDLAPPLAGSTGLGELMPTTWQTGPEGKLHQTARPFPWVDGRVVIVIGTVPSRTLAIEL